jgi:hypothetical protein
MLLPAMHSAFQFPIPNSLFSIPLAAGQFLLEAPWLWPVAAGAVLVVLLAVLRLYPRQLAQGRGLGAGRWILPGLRVLGLAALAAAFVKPVVLRMATSADRGAVVVLVDRSASMGVTDNARSISEQVALCDALGRLPAGLRSGPGAPIALSADIARLRPLVEQVRSAQDDLEYARISGQELPAKQAKVAQAISHFSQAVTDADHHAAELGPAAAGLAHLVHQLANIPSADARQSWAAPMNSRIEQASAAVERYQQAADEKLYADNADVRTACEAIAQLNRFALAKAVLLGPRGLFAGLQGKMPVTCDAFASGLTPLALTPTAPELPAGTDPTGVGTDITGAIPAALSLQQGAQGGAVRAVVLLSDGRQVGGDRNQVAGLTPAGVPIYTVPMASASPPRDVAIDPDVQAPTAAFVGETIAVRALIRQSGFDGSRATVTLSGAGDPAQTRQIVLRDRQPRRSSVDFSVKLSQPGAQRLTLSVSPLKDEATIANNTVQRWIKVLPRRMEVAVYSGSAGWDFQYLRNALDRTPWVQPSTGELRDSTLCPLSPAEILEQNVIVLMDVPAAALDTRQWEAVNTLVRERGGSVILVAGDSHLPAEYGTSGLTAGLLPYDPQWVHPAWRVSPGRTGENASMGGFQLLPDPSAEGMEMLRLGGVGGRTSGSAAEQSLRQWEELPGMYRLLELPTGSPGTVLRPGARVLLREAQARWPVLTEMRLGAGRAFFFGADETWRWRYRAGGEIFDRFWLQLIRYAAEEPYFAVDNGLALDADLVSAAPGQAVHVRARLPVPAGPARAPASADVEIWNGKNRIETHPLPALGGGRYGGTIALAAGDYELRLRDGAKTVAVPLHVEQTDEAELADVSGDAGFLGRIAEASGGERVPLDRIGRLPELLDKRDEAGTRYVEMRLWDSPYLFLFVVACFSAEWALRKRYGLA